MYRSIRAFVTFAVVGILDKSHLQSPLRSSRGVQGVVSITNVVSALLFVLGFVHQIYVVVVPVYPAVGLTQSWKETEVGDF